MSSIDFIKQVSAGETSKAKDTITSLISQVAFEALDNKKQEVAQSFLAPVEESVKEPSINVRSLYAQRFAKHMKNTTKGSEAQDKAYNDVEKKHGSDVCNALKAYHTKNYNS